MVMKDWLHITQIRTLRPHHPMLFDIIPQDIKLFQVLLFNTNESIQHSLRLLTNSFKQRYLIQFNINHLLAHS